jgi:dGTPase
MSDTFPPVTAAARAELDLRQWETEKGDRSSGVRTPAQRDRDRVLYCSAFQRLAYVTQVTAPEGGYSFHNRLNHSLKVAQVGRRNTERLVAQARDGSLEGEAAAHAELLDPDSVEAACLAHDLGHPPFGHICEWALRTAAQEKLGDGFDAFEGNAQSFRIVTRLAVRRGNPGLDLSRRTLDGLLKYPWAYSENASKKAHRKWGYYGDDADAFKFVRPVGGDVKSVAAEIMDWADDLTYAVHDLDDFFRAGLIPLHRLSGEKSPEFETLELRLDEARAAESDGFPPYSTDELRGALVRALRESAPDTRYENTLSDRASMREFGSQLITRYLEAFRLAVDEPGGPARLRIDSDRCCEVEALKLLVRVYVIRRPGLAVVQHGQERMMKDLFNLYFEASEAGSRGDRRLFPPEARTRLGSKPSSEERARIVIDFLAGLTEVGAVKLYQGLNGGSALGALDATADRG